MPETWDLSLLIDTSTKIFDARGMTGHHLGVEARNLPDHFFIEYVDPDNRGPFRRRLVKLAAKQLEMVRVRVLTRNEGSQEFFAALRESKVEGQWWLMLAAGLRDETPALAALERTGLAEGDEFMMLVESAARQLNGAVDLMQVTAGILSDPSAGKTTPEVRQKLESEFDGIVTENAYDNIATKSQPGEYLLLKDRAKPAAEVMNQLSAAAERLSIPPAELGLAARTMAMEELGGDFSQANINGVVFDLRHDPSKPIKQWELEPQAESWIKPVIRGAAAALGLKPAKTGRSRP
jgi:hypothetical protein